MGERYGRLLVLALAGSDRRGSRKVYVACDCGVHKTVLADNVRRGRTQSCGCLARELAADRYAA